MEILAEMMQENDQGLPPDIHGSHCKEAEPIKGKSVHLDRLVSKSLAIHEQMGKR